MVFEGRQCSGNGPVTFRRRTQAVSATQNLPCPDQRPIPPTPNRQPPAESHIYYLILLPPDDNSFQSYGRPEGDVCHHGALAFSLRPRGAVTASTPTTSRPSPMAWMLEGALRATGGKAKGFRALASSACLFPFDVSNVRLTDVAKRPSLEATHFAEGAEIRLR